MQDLSRRYPVWLCDVWGVVHNGVVPFPTAVTALSRHRQEGGTVILVTNAPRTRQSVERQMARIGVDRYAYDLMVTSGDATRELARRHGGEALYHLGPSHDRSIFEGLPARLVPIEEAQAVLCTGLFDDENDRLEDYASLLARMKARNLVMICANPDKMVRKGERLLYCGGKLAEMYEAKGGQVLMAGKPHTPIYDLALFEAARLRATPVTKDMVLAIGDGPETDIRGAARSGFAALLVAEGINDASLGLAEAEAEARKIVPEARIVRTMRHLAWE